MSNEIHNLEKRKAFLQEVYDEIETIREKATDEEKAKLDIWSFAPTDGRRCIYGQMTGQCDSVRAIEIMQKSIPNRNVWGPQVGFTPLERYIVQHERTPDVNPSIIEYIKGERSRPDLPLPRKIPES